MYRIHRADNRTFLEVERFDRHGEFGRSAVRTLAALDALFGPGGEPPLQLAPAYDMLPMLHAPADDRISTGFRAVCKVNGRELKRLRALAA
ncbi:hypothetical protein [Duganella flavida]|uniref:hypothetical protein n=1 Tax=Duganella flavida TaxID=2692175 RepID=UPI001928DAB2|nr:hypothetical protein [Duganella flavida]